MKKSIKQMVGKRIVSVILSALLAVAGVGLLPQLAMPVKAANDKTITGLGTGAIADPTPGAGEWSYVYYGTYGGNNVRYRVLDTQTSDFGGSTMLLDCDSILESMQHNTSTEYNTAGFAYSWSNSHINAWLNGNDFYGNTNVFTVAEKAAIAASTKSGVSNSDGQGRTSLVFQSLTGEHIFLLDAKEVTNTSYGYPSSYDDNVLRVKSGADTWWWLRSPVDSNTYSAGDVDYDGYESIVPADDNDGVSPAFNLTLSSVIFSSLISGTSGASGAAYKLTMKDANMSVAVTGGSSISRSGTTITVPYTISGSNAGNASQVSVVITDSAWTLGTPVTSGYTYLKLTVDTFGTTGTGTFTLPAAYADKTCGTDYYAYIVAEDVNTGNATDYASTPVSITVPAASGGGSSTPPPAPAPTVSQPEPPAPDFFDDLRGLLKEAIEKGGEQTVNYDKGNMLPYDIMKLLEDNPQITLVYEYSYLGTDYKAIIAGKDVKTNILIFWYGPLYLNQYFGSWRLGLVTTANLPIPNAIGDIVGQNATGTYTVKAGDTLWGIAIRMHTTVEHLVTVNNIQDPDKIQVGQVINY